MLLHDKFIADIWEIFLFIIHCVKNVQIESFSGPYFPTYGLNIYVVNLRIQSEKTSYLDTFHVVLVNHNIKSSCLEFTEKNL